MSLISRLLRRSSPAPVPPVTKPPAGPVEVPPRPDPAARAREEEALLSQALAAGDMAAVGRWVLEGGSTRIRQMAARAVTDLDQLRELIRATRGGRDNTVHRILSDERDQVLAELRRAAQLRADLEAAAAAIAQHSRQPCDARYEATLRQLETRWSLLAANASAEVQQAVTGQLERAHENLRQHRLALELAAEQKRGARRAEEEARHKREIEAQAAATEAAEQASQRAAERLAAQAKRKADEAEVHALIGLLRQARAALGHGGTARAARLRDALRERLPGAPALPPWFPHELEGLDSRIEEMRDWKTFTVVPKRAALIERMRSLVGADIAPEELARQVRRLRDEWRSLGRGAGEDPAPEWQQFDEAADRAYAPCREHFARQAALRRENQAQREALLARLATFTAELTSVQVDWDAVQQALIAARREWRRYAPVDPAAVKSLQDRFRALTDDLQARLDAEYARNLSAKRELIARSMELADLDDTQRAVETARSLQRTWKIVGLVPRREANALRDEFRRHCDAVFQRSAQQAAAAATAREAERQANETRQRQRAEAARRGWNDLFAAASQVHAYALAVARQRPAAESEALRAAAAAAIDSLADTPRGANSVLDRRMSQTAGDAAGVDLAANEGALRLLCVRAELIVDAPTPEEDLGLRRDHQMQRLVASMGRGERVTPADLEDLALEWIAVGPVETEVYDRLYARFSRCCGRMLRPDR